MILVPIHFVIIDATSYLLAVTTEHCEVSCNNLITNVAIADTKTFTHRLMAYIQPSAAVLAQVSGANLLALKTQLSNMIKLIIPHRLGDNAIAQFDQENLSIEYHGLQHEWVKIESSKFLDVIQTFLQSQGSDFVATNDHWERIKESLNYFLKDDYNYFIIAVDGVASHQKMALSQELPMIDVEECSEQQHRMRA